MDSKTFDIVLEERIKKIRSILSKKRSEYAPDGQVDDRLHNFARAASMLGVSKEKALIGMWAKHVVSLLDIVDGVTPNVTQELIDEKIGDAINYLILLEAALLERK